MKSIGAAKFKEKCLEIMDSLDSEGIIISKHGKPIAKLIPIESSSKSLIGSLKHKIKVHGKIESTGKKWNAKS